MGGSIEGKTPVDVATIELEEELSLSASKFIELGEYVSSPDRVEALGGTRMILALDCNPCENPLPQEPTEFFRNRIELPIDDAIAMIFDGRIKCLVTQSIIMKAFIHQQKMGVNVGYRCLGDHRIY